MYLFDPSILPGGVVLPHDETGPPGADPVLMLPGLSDSSRSFAPLSPHLPESIRAIAATQRGHGDAAKPLAGYRVEELAGDARALLDRLGIRRAVVVGHSLGAWVATKLAADHPDRVSGLLLEGAIGPAGGNPVVSELFAEIATMSDPVDPDFVTAFQAGTAVAPLAPGLLEEMVGESMKLPARVWRELGRGFAATDLRADLARIRVPTRLAWGEHDPITTLTEQRNLLAAVEGAELSVYEGVGHTPHWERPRRFAKELAAFAAGCRTRVPAGARVAVPA